MTPDDPLVLGAVDALEEAGIPCFGPRADAAIIEGSKVFSKALMARYGIPTARFESFDALGDALAYLEKLMPKTKKDEVVVLCLSGRGDKDVQMVAKALGEEL